MRRYVIHDPIYDERIEVFVGDVEAFNRLFSRRCGDVIPVDEKAYGSSVSEPKKGGGAWRMLWFEGFRNDYFHLNLVVHECFHMTKAVMEWKEISLGNHTDETWAYYHAWMVTEVLKKLQAKKGGRK